MKIGFIGIGIMGAPMAGHLLDGGHELVAYNRSAISQVLIDKGAIVVSSAKEAAESGDVIIIMVPDTPDVESVLFGEDGVAILERVGSRGTFVLACHWLRQC